MVLGEALVLIVPVGVDGVGRSDGEAAVVDASPSDAGVADGVGTLPGWPPSPVQPLKNSSAAESASASAARVLSIFAALPARRSISTALRPPTGLTTASRAIRSVGRSPSGLGDGEPSNSVVPIVRRCCRRPLLKDRVAATRASIEGK